VTSQPKTIQIFLPDGNARSLRIAEITSRTIQAIQVPRSKLKAASQREEVQRVGVYFLIGEADEETSKPSAYIGEAENCYQRLTEHHRSKEFWNTAIAITSKTLSFTKAHAKYLEYDCLQRARKADRYRLENGHAPTEPHIPEPMLAELNDNFGTIQTLLAVLGFPVLEPLASLDTRRLLHCQSKDADARGEYTEEGLVVFKGSKANLDETPSASDALRQRRARLQEDGILIERGGVLVFTEDHAFGSPSAAATTVLGRSSNGWTAWKDSHGKTLDELERQ
jgi:hypothetical protein